MLHFFHSLVTQFKFGQLRKILLELYKNIKILLKEWSGLQQVLYNW